MTREKKGRADQRAGAAGVVAPSAEGTAKGTMHLHIIAKSAPMSSFGDLPALATEAIRKADAARLLATCCQVAGDVAGRERWRRRMLAHQAIHHAAVEEMRR
jgi:hypothetical protein